jgi:pimeloyl-ACP methyl ester carboxylesterase
MTCLDLPGHGFSKITSGESFFSFQQMDYALEDFIRHTLQPPVILIGHSLGGWLAARYAAKHPESVKHLILIDNAGIKYEGFERQVDVFTLKSVDDMRRLLQKMWFSYPWYYKPFTSSMYVPFVNEEADQSFYPIDQRRRIAQSFLLFLHHAARRHLGSRRRISFEEVCRNHEATRAARKRTLHTALWSCTTIGTAARVGIIT